jgi:hypothetical protein
VLRMLTSTASQTRGRILPLGKRVLEGRFISDAKSVAQVPCFGISEAACWQDLLASKPYLSLTAGLLPPTQSGRLATRSRIFQHTICRPLHVLSSMHEHGHTSGWRSSQRMRRRADSGVTSDRSTSVMCPVIGEQRPKLHNTTPPR